MSASLKWPSETSFSDLMAAPSWYSSRECGGIEPGRMPPMSAW